MYGCQIGTKCTILHAKQGPNVLFCMSNRTNCILLVNDVDLLEVNDSTCGALDHAAK
jgi:hypothetical protein